MHRSATNIEYRSEQTNPLRIINHSITKDYADCRLFMWALCSTHMSQSTSSRPADRWTLTSPPLPPGQNSVSLGEPPRRLPVGAIPRLRIPPRDLPILSPNRIHLQRVCRYAAPSHCPGHALSQNQQKHPPQPWVIRGDGPETLRMSRSKKPFTSLILTAIILLGIYRTSTSSAICNKTTLGSAQAVDKPTGSLSSWHKSQAPSSPA